MPTVGKTKIGILLAQQSGRHFVDTDHYIMRAVGAATLQEVVDRLPAAVFAALEEQVVISITHMLSRATVIATGGSVVYSERAMEALRQKTHIIHLRSSLETIERRIAKNPNRGLVLSPGETIADLYRRRMPMYERWAHREVQTDHKRPLVAKQLAATFSHI